MISIHIFKTVFGPLQLRRKYSAMVLSVDFKKLDFHCRETLNTYNAPFTKCSRQVHSCSPALDI